MHRSKSKWALVIAGLVVVLLIPVLWCGRTLSLLLPTTAPDAFPDAEIVFNAAGELGFLNADGSGLSIVPLTIAYTNFAGGWQSPFMLGDGRTIIVTYGAVPGYQGTVFAIPAGEKPVQCGWYGSTRLAADGVRILVSTGAGIEEYLLEDCGTGNAPENLHAPFLGVPPPDELYSGSVGALSPDGQYVAEIREKAMGVREPKIIIRHIATGEERFVGVGDFPVWSRDGEWLAYTGQDGLYLLRNAPNAEFRPLVQLESPEPQFGTPVYQVDRTIAYYPPIASWSPDRKWLVYHVYSKSLVAPDAGEWAGHYSIFKVNVNTGQTRQLLDGGYSPSWRWPAGE